MLWRSPMPSKNPAAAKDATTGLHRSTRMIFRLCCSFSASCMTVIHQVTLVLSMSSAQWIPWTLSWYDGCHAILVHFSDIPSALFHFEVGKPSLKARGEGTYLKGFTLLPSRQPSFWGDALQGLLHSTQLLPLPPKSAVLASMLNNIARYLKLVPGFPLHLIANQHQDRVLCILLKRCKKK